MTTFDLVIQNGTVVTATKQIDCDIGISQGKIHTLGHDLGARETIDADGKLVLPGGIDSHCHIEQLSSFGIVCADDFYTGTVSAAFGGTTTIIPFAAQHRGQSLKKVVSDYHKRARSKAVVDYAFHMIISDPGETVMGEELTELIRQGCTSFKVYMTYDALRLDDYQVLEIFSLARREGALTMVHAENHDMIQWLTKRLLDAGHRAPKFHAVSHAKLAEGEATSRAISLAELVDTPLLVVHVSTEDSMRAIHQAQKRGLKIYGETCPQYLFLTADDLDKEGIDGAMCCCSPPPRDAASQEAMWRGLEDGTFQVFSSDHAPYRFDETGKLAQGPNASFKEIANGVPGLEVRMPLLFSEGVGKERIDIHRFVDLTATRAAQLYGIYPQKGTIAEGADADIAIWDPNKEFTITAEAMHDNVGYTPYEGRRVKGVPTTVISRGRVVVDEGELKVDRGSGKFVACGRPDSARPLGRESGAQELARRFGAEDIF
jgi:dihydropyrimidinase